MTTLFATTSTSITNKNLIKNGAKKRRNKNWREKLARKKGRGKLARIIWREKFGAKKF